MPWMLHLSVTVAAILSAQAFVQDGSPSCMSAPQKSISDDEHSLMQVPPSQMLQLDSSDWPARVTGAMHSVTFKLPNVSFHLPNTSNLPGSASVNNVTSGIAAGVGHVTSRITAGAGNVTSRIASAVHLPIFGFARSETEFEHTAEINGSHDASPRAPANSSMQEAPPSNSAEDLKVNVVPGENLTAEIAPRGTESPAFEDLPPATRNPSEQELGTEIERAEPVWELEEKLALAAMGLKNIGGLDVTEKAQNVLDALNSIAGMLDAVKNATAAPRNTTANAVANSLADAFGNVPAALRNVSGHVNLSSVVRIVQNATSHLLEDYMPHLLDAVGPFLSPELAKKHGMLVRVGDIFEETGVRGEEMSMAERSFQGDMVADSDEQLQLFQTISSGERGPYVAAGKPWSGGHVKYCFASDVVQEVRSRFVAAVEQIERATCLTFEDVGWEAGDSMMPSSMQRCNMQPAIFVMSRPNYGCYSVVGQSWQPSQQLQLQNPGCTSQGVIMHELGHSLGMAHEHSRPDRDEFIKVNWNNIQDQWVDQFDISPDAYVGVPYAYLSLMHYDPYAFSKDRRSLPTIEARSGHNGDIGQRSGFAQDDISQLMKMYEVEVPGCIGNPINGTGCVDMPGNGGSEICSGLSKCGGITNERCCACGGGVEVQCYAGEECPSMPQLPRDDRRDCLVDKTALFVAHGDVSEDEACIVHNLCDTTIKFKCHVASCTHSSKPGAYQSDFCHGKPTMQICANPELCEVWDVAEEAMYSPAGPIDEIEPKSEGAGGAGHIGVVVATLAGTSVLVLAGSVMYSYWTATSTAAAAAL